MRIVDLYAGCGGWSEGLASHNLTDIGFEWMPEACATRTAAGHQTIRADLAEYPPHPCDVLIASPPCQTFSAAGKGDGLPDIAKMVDKVGRGDWSTDWLDPRSAHLLVPGRWVESGCSTVLLEQVPAVLPVWDAYARLLRHRGWSAWCGVLNSADYGVPQTRRRAILIASRARTVTCPAPTHCEGGADSLFGMLAPWVSMAEALGWMRDLNTGCDWKPGGVRADAQKIRATRPAPTLTAIADTQWQWQPPPPSELVSHLSSTPWYFDRPATTLAGDQRVFPPGGHYANDGRDNSRMVGRSENTIKLTVEQALTLQSFRPDYPLQGTKSARFLQVGNAVPPLLATHIIAEGLGL